MQRANLLTGRGEPAIFQPIFIVSRQRSSVGKESACHAGDPSSVPGLGRSPGEGIGYPLKYSWASLVAQLVKNLPARCEDLGLIPGVGRSPGGGNGNPLQYFNLKNPHGQRSLLIYIQSMGSQKVGQD